MTLIRATFVRVVLLTMLAAMFFGGSTLAAGQKEWIVHSFNTVSGGLYPMGSLISDSAGNLYGTTEEGGAFTNWGMVYELVRPLPPKTLWTQAVLYSFTGGADGSTPIAGLVFDKAGNLYGTTSKGGPSGNGVVFELVAPSTTGGKWSEIVLHAFQSTSSDGGSPRGELARDGAGNLYGVTTAGGASQQGTVFQLSPPAAQDGVWTETVIHSFNYGQGMDPEGGPVVGAQGILYGTTYSGGLDGEGVIYRLVPPATRGGSWVYRVLHPFTGGLDGASPKGELTLRGKGILYGTATRGGSGGGGIIFQLVPPVLAGGAWTENVLYNFGSAASDGLDPAAKVIFDSVGNAYGTTSTGGACFQLCGTVFELSPPTTEGADWTERILHSFPTSGGKDGSQPSGSLILGKNGVLFGATNAGGTGGNGTVYGVLK